MICTFFGHRDAPPEIKPLLREVLLDLIERQGVKQFYVGNQGNFDAMAVRLLKEFEKLYSITYDVVLWAYGTYRSIKARPRLCSPPLRR